MPDLRPGWLRPAVRVVGAAWVLVLVTACQTVPGPGCPTGPVTATITPAGGSIRVVGDDGAVLELDFPAGAVAEPLSVTVTPRTAIPGTEASFDLHPAGTMLRQPLVLTFQAPEGVELSGSSTFRFEAHGDRALLPSLRTAPRELRATTRMLGYAESFEDAVQRSQLSDADTLAIAAMECQIALDSLMERLEMARNYSFSYPEPAHQLIQQIEATRLLCEMDPGTFEAQIPIIQQQACEGYRDATATAAALPSDSGDALRANVGRIINWTAVRDLAATDCDGLGGDHQEAIENEFDEFIDAFTKRVDEGSLPSTYSGLWNEKRDVENLRAHAEYLGRPEIAQKIDDKVLAEIYDLLRDAAYEHCVDTSQQVYLADLLWNGAVVLHPVATSLTVTGQAARAAVGNLPHYARFSSADLAADIQLCGARVEVEVFTPVPERRDDLTREVRGGDTPGTHQTSAATRAPATGSLVLDGELPAFRCTAPDRLGDDELVVKLDGTVIRRVPRSGNGYLTSRVDIDLEDAISTAGIDATKKASYPLELYREGDACGGAHPFGEPSAKLFTIELEIDPAPQLTGLSAGPTSLVADAATAVTFSLPFQDEGENLTTLRVAWNLVDTAGTYTVDLTTSDQVSGFTAPSGTGTYQATIEVFCSEQGKNPLTLRMTLSDDFEQESEEQSVALTVSYGGCP
jgi:hypothetical protein